MRARQTSPLPRSARRLAGLALLLACRSEPRVAATERPEAPAPAPAVTPAATADAAPLPSAPTTPDALATAVARARAAGIPDLAAQLRTRLLAQRPEGDQRLELLRDLVDAGRAADARALADALARDPALAPRAAATLRDLPRAASGLDPAAAAAIHAALAADDPARAAGLAEAALARGDQLDLLLWLGAARWREGQVSEARRAWARARGLLAGDAPVLWVSEPLGVDALAWGGDRRLALLRARRSTDDASAPLPLAELWELGERSPAREVVLGDRVLRSAGLAFTPDGARLVVAVEGRLEALDPVTGARLTSAELPAPALHFAAAAEAARFAVSLDTGEVQVFDAALRPLARFQLRGTTPSVRRIYTSQGVHHLDEPLDIPTVSASIALDPAGTRLAVGGTDGEIRLFDVAGRRAGPVLKNPRGRPTFYATARVYEVVGLRFAGADLLAIYGDGTQVRWDPASGKLRDRLEGACTPEEYARTFARVTGEARPDARALAECGETVMPAVFDREAARVVLSGAHGGLRVRDTRTGSPGHVLETMNQDAVAFAPGGARLAAGGVDGSVHLFSLPDGARVPGIDVAGLGGWVLDVSSDGRRLVVRGHDEVAAWDPARGEALARRPARGLTRARLGPDGRALALADDQGRVTLVSLTGGADLLLGRVSAPALALAFRPDGRQLAVGGKGDLRLHDLADRTSTPLLGPLAEIDDLAYSGDGRVLAVGERGGGLHVFDVAAGRSLARIGGAGRQDVRVDLDATGELLAAVLQDDGVLRLYAARTGEARGELRDPARIVDARFTPEGLLALAFRDGGAGLWDPRERRELGPRVHVAQRAERSELAAGGRALLVHALGGTLHVFDRGGGERLLDLYPVQDAAWIARSPAGAVDDGGEGRRAVRARVLAGPSAGVYPSALVWDLLAAPALLPRAAAGEHVSPPGR